MRQFSYPALPENHSAYFSTVPTKLTATDDLKAFLATLESGSLLCPLLTEEFEHAHYALSKEEAADYLTLHGKILPTCGLSPT